MFDAVDASGLMCCHDRHSRYCMCGGVVVTDNVMMNNCVVDDSCIGDFFWVDNHLLSVVDDGVGNNSVATLFLPHRCDRRHRCHVCGGGVVIVNAMINNCVVDDSCFGDFYLG